jgi:hypothetical protein
MAHGASPPPSIYCDIDKGILSSCPDHVFAWVTPPGHFGAVAGALVCATYETSRRIRLRTAVAPATLDVRMMPDAAGLLRLPPTFFAAFRAGFSRFMPLT